MFETCFCGLNGLLCQIFHLISCLKPLVRQNTKSKLIPICLNTFMTGFEWISTNFEASLLLETFLFGFRYGWSMAILGTISGYLLISSVPLPTTKFYWHYILSLMRERYDAQSHCDFYHSNLAIVQ